MAKREEMLPSTGPPRDAPLFPSNSYPQWGYKNIPTPDSGGLAGSNTGRPWSSHITQVLGQGEAGKLEKSQLTEKSYYDEWAGGRLEVDNDIVYHYEIKRWSSLWQLRIQVLPPRLWRVIIAACH
jgi:hypothetical protein